MKHLKATSFTCVSKLVTNENLHLPLETLFRFGCIFHRPAESSWPYKNIKATRLHENREVKPGDYLRIHTDPRFYPEADRIDWNDRIVERTEEFVILNKPSGVPSHSTSDNGVQNCLYAMKLHLGVTCWLPHRLDTDTSGILVAALTILQQ